MRPGSCESKICLPPSAQQALPDTVGARTRTSATHDVTRRETSAPTKRFRREAHRCPMRGDKTPQSTPLRRPPASDAKPSGEPSLSRLRRASPVAGRTAMIKCCWGLNSAPLNTLCQVHMLRRCDIKLPNRAAPIVSHAPMPTPKTGAPQTMALRAAKSNADGATSPEQGSAITQIRITWEAAAMKPGRLAHPGNRPLVCTRARAPPMVPSSPRVPQAPQAPMTIVATPPRRRHPWHKECGPLEDPPAMMEQNDATHKHR